MRKQMLRDKNIINKDLIDFHPQGLIKSKEEDISEIVEAEPLVDRKAILLEQKMKRKHKAELERREQEEVEAKKQMGIAQLEMRLRLQKEEFLKRQFVSQERKMKKVAEQRKKNASAP